MMGTKIIITTAFLSVIMTISCSDKIEITDQNKEQPTINFVATLEEPPKSGYLDETGNFSIGDVLGVFGYKVPATGTWSNNELPNLMHNITLTKQFFDDGSTNGIINYVYSPQSLWPETSEKVRFFSYYPHNISVAPGTITPSPPTYAGYPFVELTLGTSKTPVDFVTAQTDLMSKADGTTGDGVTLKFGHRLSKLMFKVKATGLNDNINSEETRKMYINQLKIKNISNKAKYTFSDPETNGGWTEHSSQSIDASSGATISANSVMAAIGENDYQDLIDPHGAGSYILMIPQTYDNVQFEVVYTIERLNENGGCEDRTVVIKQFPVSAKWESGQVYTYFLEFGLGDISEENITLSLSVKPWVSDGYDIEMGS